MKIVISTRYSFSITRELCEYLAANGVEEAIELLEYENNRDDDDDDDWCGYAYSEILRNNPFLIQGIENGIPCNFLKVVEIPDDVKYYITESEISGAEVIHEEHRIWH